MDARVSREEVEALLAAVAQATPGPWELSNGETEVCGYCVECSNGNPGGCVNETAISGASLSAFTVDCGDYMGLRNEDAAFIALARNLAERLAADWLAREERERKLRQAAEQSTVYMEHRPICRPSGPCDCGYVEALEMVERAIAEGREP